MKLSPIKDQLLSSDGQIARHDPDVFNAHSGLVFSKNNMKVRWLMVIEIHAYENAVKAADGWHDQSPNG